jgi:hypothetical protein
MPKTSGKVIRCLEKDGKVGAVIQFNGKVPRAGEQVTIKWGAVRSNSQNALYWAFLGWLLDAGLKDEYGTTEELHESLKAAFLSATVLARALLVEIFININSLSRFLLLLQHPISKMVSTND